MFPKWLNAAFKLNYCYIKRHAVHICFTIKGVDSLAFFSDILWDLTRSVFLEVLALAKSVRRWFVVKSSRESVFLQHVSTNMCFWKKSILKFKRKLPSILPPPSRGPLGRRRPHRRCRPCSKEKPIFTQSTDCWSPRNPVSARGHQIFSNHKYEQCAGIKEASLHCDTMLAFCSVVPLLCCLPAIWSSQWLSNISFNIMQHGAGKPLPAPEGFTCYQIAPLYLR